MLTASGANAGAFSLYNEGNGSAVSNYGAGLPAEAIDASTGWFNPAGLALIHENQLVFGGVGVLPTARLTGLNTVVNPPLPAYSQAFSRLSMEEHALIPSFHAAHPIGENASLGISLVSPFGLRTRWRENSPVRYAATVSELVTANLSPEIGAKITENLALGLGIDFQHASVKFNRVLGAPNAMQSVGLPAYYLDSISYNKGNSFGLGFHVGVLALFNDNHTRLGLNYQSQMSHKFHGYSKLSGPLAQPGLAFTPGSLLTLDSSSIVRTNTLSSNTINFPEVVALGLYHDINEGFAFLGTLYYTGWDSLKTIQLNNAYAFAANPISPALPGSQVLVTSTSEEHYRNVWHVALGGNYCLQDQWMLRFGGGYDQTPVTDAYRSIRVPDGDRWALAAGLRYQPYANLTLDAGYTHLFVVGGPRINRIDPLGTTSANILRARVRSYANLVGAQVTWRGGC